MLAPPALSSLSEAQPEEDAPKKTKEDYIEAIKKLAKKYFAKSESTHDDDCTNTTTDEQNEWEETR